MPLVALGVVVVYLVLAFGLRSWLQWRRTGSNGFRGVSGARGSPEWFGGMLFVAAMVGVILAPVAELAGLVEPAPALDHPSVQIVGVVLCGGGLAGTLWAQFAMGDSWRIGVDSSDQTPLVTRGPFRLVRNPIFSFMTLGLAGIALLVPNPIAAAALFALIAGLELQVRLVEEPYLVEAHGEKYRAYASRVGRFVPGVGRLASGKDSRW